jgi:hypothetical protein
MTWNGLCGTIRLGNLIAGGDQDLLVVIQGEIPGDGPYLFLHLDPPQALVAYPDDLGITIGRSNSFAQLLESALNVFHRHHAIRVQVQFLRIDN